MWQGFNQLANAVKEHAELATRDLGLDSQLETARKVASGLLLDASPSKGEGHVVEPQEQGRHHLEGANGGVEGTFHYPQQLVGSEPAVPRWHPSDNGGFDEVPLGSPPLKPASADSNGGPPHLEKVARSLRAYSKAEKRPQDTSAGEASQLRSENASLKQRLSAIESEAADVFGELEDLKDKLQASERARLAAEAASKALPQSGGSAGCEDLSEDIQVLQAELKAHREAAEKAQHEAASSRKDADGIQERARGMQEEMSRKLQITAAERDALSQQVQALQQSAQPSAEDTGPEDKVTAGDEALDWKAKATKLKRQALNFKTKYSEAAAACDAALAELEALKEENVRSMQLVSGRDNVEEEPSVSQQLEELQNKHISMLSEQQSITEILHRANKDNENLMDKLKSGTSQLGNLQEEREALLKEQASLIAQLERLRQQVESHEAASMELQQAGQRQEDLVGQLQSELATARQSVESLQQQMDVLTAQRDLSTAEAAAASELEAKCEKAAQQLEDLQRQLQEEQLLHASQLAEARKGHQSLEAEARANMQQAEEDRRLALSLAEERLQEIQALRADLQNATEVPLPLPAPAVHPSEPTAAVVDSASGSGASHVEQGTAGFSNSADTAPSEGATVQSNPLFSPVREAPAEAYPSCETPSALPSRKPGAAMRKIRELQTALNRKEIELVATQAQLQAALEAAQGRKADEACESERSSAVGGLSNELEALLNEKQAAEAECSRLQEVMSELTASLDKELKLHMSTQEELSLVREQSSVQTAETEAASQRLHELEAELESVRSWAAQLQLALDAATEEVQAKHAAAESAISQSEKAATMAHDLKQQRAELQEQLASLQGELDRRELELSSLKDGSATESGLAIAALREAESRAAAAEEAAASALETAEAAQAAMQNAQNEASSSIGAANKRCEQAQELCRQLETELAEARAEAEALRDALDVERAAAHAAAAALRESLEQQHAADKARALGDASVDFKQQLQEQREQVDKEVASQSLQLKDASARIQELESDLKAAQSAAEGHAEDGQRLLAVLQESEQLRQQLVQATSELQAVQQEASEAQAAARERQKRFTMLNATYRRKEEALVSRAEEAEGALSQARNETAEAKHLAAQAKQEAVSVQKLVESLESGTHAASSKCAAAEKARDSAEKAAADASAELVTLRLALQSLQAAQSRALADAGDCDQRVAAAVAVREEELVEQARQGEKAVQHALEELQRAEARSAAAEAAKIELSLRLAAALSEQEMAEDVSAVPSVSAKDSKQSPEDAMQRMEELELAASVASRRASAAEGELHSVKQQLELTDKRAKELAWQIKMISDPRQIGGQQGRAEASSGMTASVLDMFGCGATVRR